MLNSVAKMAIPSPTCILLVVLIAASVTTMVPMVELLDNALKIRADANQPRNAVSSARPCINEVWHVLSSAYHALAFTLVVVKFRGGLLVQVHGNQSHHLLWLMCKLSLVVQ